MSETRLKELWGTRIKPKVVVEVTEVEPVREDGEEGAQPEAQTVTVEDGFNEEPFVRAAVAFREMKFHGILELLSEAITNGRPVSLCVCIVLSVTCSPFIIVQYTFHSVL